MKLSSCLRSATKTEAVFLRRVAKPLLACVCLLFLTAQMAGLSHIHDGDLRLQAECDVCLNLSTDGDVAVDQSQTDLHFINSHSSKFVLPDWAPFSNLIIRARAPPLA